MNLDNASIQLRFERIDRRLARSQGSIHRQDILFHFARTLGVFAIFESIWVQVDKMAVYMIGQGRNLGFARDIKGQADTNNRKIIGGEDELGEKSVHNNIVFLFSEENRKKQIACGQSVCFYPMYVW
jgi:hypothetical protein